MSLILEALKKSEARRQLGEAPGLGTPFTVTQRRRSALPVIIIGIIAAGVFGWYYLGSGPAAPGAVPPPSGTNAKAPGGGTVTAMKPAGGNVAAVPRPAPGNAQRSAAAPMGRVAPNPAVNVVPPQAADLAATRQQQLAAANAPATQPAAGTVKPEPPAAPAPAPASSSPKPAMATATPPPNATAAPQPAPPAAPTASAAPTAPAVPAAPAAPAEPPAPMYYELPYNVRKDLPPLNVTMHVYAAMPAQRFIVVDGERKAEGESLKDGLTLKTIRNDGVILEFRGQQFFYPRPGH